jgi:hypothetical protein
METLKCSSHCSEHFDAAWLRASKIQAKQAFAQAEQPKATGLKTQAAKSQRTATAKGQCA